MNPAFDSSLTTRIEKCGIIAVLVIESAEDAVPLAQALIDGGVDVIELTLRTDAAMDALVAIRSTIPEMLVGVGTVLKPAQVKEVADAGAAFGVAPGFNVNVVRAAREAGLSFAPGVITPSEVELALAEDCKLMKFFPAIPAGGLPYLKSMLSPFAHLGLRFIPLGGLAVHNMATFISDPQILAIGGSWLAPRELIRAKQWEAITHLAAKATAIIRQTRNQATASQATGG